MTNSDLLYFKKIKPAGWLQEWWKDKQQGDQLGDGYISLGENVWAPSD